MSRFVVTGGLGFIGTHVVDALRARGDEVLVIDWADGDSALWPIPGEGRVDGIVHLAARHGAGCRTARHMATNTDIDFEVAQAANTYDAPVVFASSAAVLADELTPYGASKVHGEAMLNTVEVPVSVLRLFNVYGPGQKPPAVVPSFIEAMRSGRPIEVFNGGTDVRDYVWVGDVVRQILLCLDNPADRVWPVGTGIGTLTIDLARMIADAAAAGFVATHSTRAGDVAVSVCDDPIVGPVPLAAGLALTIAGEA